MEAIKRRDAAAGTKSKLKGLLLWQRFEQATGFKLSQVRGSDVQLVARVRIKSRA